MVKAASIFRVEVKLEAAGFSIVFLTKLQNYMVLFLNRAASKSPHPNLSIYHMDL